MSDDVDVEAIRLSDGVAHAVQQGFHGHAGLRARRTLCGIEWRKVSFHASMFRDDPDPAIDCLTCLVEMAGGP